MIRIPRTVLALAFLVTALSACDALGDLLNEAIPPIENPLGVDGQEVTLGMSEEEPDDGWLTPSMAPEAVVGFGRYLLGSVSATDVPDFDLDVDIPDIKSFTTNVWFDDLNLEATVESTGELPKSLNVVAMSVVLIVDDALTELPLTLDFSVGPLSDPVVTLDRDSCETTAQLHCTYEVDMSGLKKIAVPISENVIGRFKDIFSNGEANTVTAGLVIQFAEDAFGVGLTFDGATATIKTDDGTLEVF